MTQIELWNLTGDPVVLSSLPWAPVEVRFVLHGMAHITFTADNPRQVQTIREWALKACPKLELREWGGSYLPAKPLTQDELLVEKSRLIAIKTSLGW